MSGSIPVVPMDEGGSESGSPLEWSLGFEMLGVSRSTGPYSGSHTATGWEPRTQLSWASLQVPLFPSLPCWAPSCGAGGTQREEQERLWVNNAEKAADWLREADTLST